MTIKEAIHAAIAEWRAEAAANGQEETDDLRIEWQDQIDTLVQEAMLEAAITE